GCDALGHEGFNDIAFLYVIEVADADTALHAVADIAGIVLEALERRDFAFVDLNTIAQQAHVGIALDLPIQDIATGNYADLRHFEGVAYFSPAQVGFLIDGIEQAGHGFLDFVLKLVNDGMQADVHFFLLRQLLRLALRTNIEA